MGDVPTKPVFQYDGDCGFCRRWVDKWSARTGDAVTYEPSPSAKGAARYLVPGGRIATGAEAVFSALEHAHGRRWLIRAYRRVPGFAPFTEWWYRWIARHRPFMYRLGRPFFPKKRDI
jgi:predicted DCC family thiol-disulfide oxidoreductase YuxK